MNHKLKVYNTLTKYAINSSIISNLNIVINGSVCLIYYKKNTTDIQKLLKLNKTVKMTNMHLYNSQGKIKKYNSVKEILEEYYIVRLEYYQKRKDYLRVLKSMMTYIDLFLI